MKVATLNIHFWSKNDESNVSDLLKEIKTKLQNIDILCLQEVVYGQMINSGLFLFSKSPKTYILFNGKEYSLPIDAQGDIHLYLYYYFGLPIGYDFSYEYDGSVIKVVSTSDISQAWLAEFPALPDSGLLAIQKMLDLPYLFFAGTANPCFGNALLSRYSFSSMKCIPLIGNAAMEYSTRVAICALVNAPKQFYVVNIHLDHLSEHERLVQARYLVQAIHGLSQPVVLAGDFNSLTEADYTDYYQQDIIYKRKEFKLEPISFDVMKYFNDYGYYDSAWHCPNRAVCGSAEATTRYQTRIDYILASQPLIRCVDDYQVIYMNESDHNCVASQFTLAYLK